MRRNNCSKERTKGRGSDSTRDESRNKSPSTDFQQKIKVPGVGGETKFSVALRLICQGEAGFILYISIVLPGCAILPALDIVTPQGTEYTPRRHLFRRADPSPTYQHLQLPLTLSISRLVRSILSQKRNPT